MFAFVWVLLFLMFSLPSWLVCFESNSSRLPSVFVCVWLLTRSRLGCSFIGENDPPPPSFPCHPHIIFFLSPKGTTDGSSSIRVKSERATPEAKNLRAYALMRLARRNQISFRSAHRPQKMGGSENSGVRERGDFWGMPIIVAQRQ